MYYEKLAKYSRRQAPAKVRNILDTVLTWSNAIDFILNLTTKDHFTDVPSVV